MVNAAAGALLLYLLILLLYYGRPLLIPFALAVMICSFIITIKGAIRQIPLVGKKIPQWLAQILAISTGLGAVWSIASVITNNLTSLMNAIPRYQERFLYLKENFLAWVGSSETLNLEDVFGPLNFVSIASTFASTIADVGTYVVVILIYLVFLLLEHQSFDTKLAKIIHHPAKLDMTRSAIKKISRKIQSYFKIKILTSMMTALLSYGVMRFAGLDFAEFWALVIFLFNFIPNIGAIAATIFPCLLALLQFESLYPFLVIATGLTLIQFTIGNFIEPKIMGRSFNLSPLAVIIALSIWGYLWGLVGMFLCVPILVIASIVLAQFPATQPIARLLSESGEID